ncbi:hypothetical protein [Mycolicibacterium sp.]|uniref:hypothetical protein n=1 Tax=Mycolicibacterium sp. TaxID=2320850 RepID=UPI0037C751AE
MGGTTLSDDQRWLLWTVGLGISRALLSDEGLESYMSSMNSYYGTARPGAPQWMDSYETRAGKITSPARGDEIRVTVTAKQIRGFRKTIRAELLTELAAIDKAETDEHWRTELWCRCHFAKGDEVKPHKDYRQREQYHPSDAEDGEHMEIVVGLRRRERDCLKAILAIGQEPVGQLALF